MTTFDMAMVDLKSIMTSYQYAVRQNDMSGSVPMPLRTVNEAYNALLLENDLMNIAHGFEVTKARALERLENCERHISSSADVDPWAIDVLHTACAMMKIVLNRYHDTCSSRYFDAKR